MKLKDTFYTAESDGQVFHIRLNREHFIFGVHFPEQPIVPGVCLIQMVGELFSEQLQKELYLHRVKNVKFMKVLSPDESLEALVEFSKTEVTPEAASVQALICHPADRSPYAKLSLEYRYIQL